MIEVVKMKKSYQSWTISDELWNKIKEYIPKKQRDPNKQYKNASGQGHPPLSHRKVSAGILDLFGN